MSLFAKVAGGLASALGGRKAQKRMSSANQALASSINTYSPEQRSAMTQRQYETAMLSPEQLAQRESGWAHAQQQQQMQDLLRSQGARHVNRFAGGGQSGGSGATAAVMRRAFQPVFEQGGLNDLAAMRGATGFLQGARGNALGFDAQQQAQQQALFQQAAGGRAAAGTMIPGVLGQIGNEIWEQQQRDRMMRAMNSGLGQLGES